MSDVDGDFVFRAADTPSRTTAGGRAWACRVQPARPPVPKPRSVDDPRL